VINEMESAEATDGRPPGEAAGSVQSRRHFLTGAATLVGGAAAFGFFGCGGDSSTAGGEAVAGGEAGKATLRFMTWGSDFGKHFRANFSDPFTKDTGIKVVDITPFDYGKFEASMKAGNPEGYDLVFFADGAQPYRAAEAGYIETLDAAKLPLGKDAIGSSLTDLYVAPYLGGYQLAYNTEALKGKKPTSWKDFFDTQNFPGGRAFGNWVAGVFEAALLADGVAPDQLYPLDTDRALKKLDTIKKAIPTFFDTYATAQSISMLTQGEVSMLLSWPGTFLQLKHQGKPVDVLFNEGFYLNSGISIVKGSKNVDAAHQYLNSMFTLDRQVGFATDQVASPVIPAAEEKLPAELRAEVILPNIDKMILLDGDYYAKNETELQAAYDKWRAT
jgi:putative spermidine/putrescine transport system substrate-binding protein